jgi:glycosyltransferase involved in cell wall biosynthesis
MLVRRCERVKVETTMRRSAEPFETAAPGMPRVLTRHGVSVVLPAWNEEGAIASTVRAVSYTLDQIAPDYEIIVVDDGSRDGTAAIVDNLAASDPHVRAIHHAENLGYGAALIAGFDAAAKEMIFFMDADGQFDIRDIAALIVPFERGEAEAILGYRQRRQDSPIRIVNAWAWKQLVSLIFGLRAHDIDCAFKLMPARLVRQADVHARGALINTELLAKFARMGVTMKQVPVRHYPRHQGKASGADLRVIGHAFRELLRLIVTLRGWSPPIEAESDPEDETPSPARAS